MSKVDDTNPSDNDQKDVISDLPYVVLSHILSRLPTKDAVRTCVLSKDWEFKWTSIYNVDIDTDYLSLKWRNDLVFVSLVEKLLARLLNLRCFSLTCDIRKEKYESSRISLLISDIFRHQVKYLKLIILADQGVVLPNNLSTYTSLRKLCLLLHRPCILNFHVNNHFPYLKLLNLLKVHLVNETADTDKMVFTFPVLKYLYLMSCKWVNVKYVEIHAPSFSAFYSRSSCHHVDMKDFGCLIRIIGAKLEDFLAIGDYPQNIAMVGSTVVSARVGCYHTNFLQSLENGGLRVRNLLRELSTVKQLRIIGSDYIRAIGQTKLGGPFSRFLELKVLSLVMPSEAKGVLEVLQAAPFLKFLIIYVNSLAYGYDSIEPLPSCVAHHLEEVTFRYTYDYENSNFVLEKFLLKNGAQLKTVVVKDKKLRVNEMVEKLSMLPKASACLKVVASPS